MSNIPLSTSLRHDGLALLEPSLKHSHQSTSSTNISGLASSGSFVRTRSMTRLSYEAHNENEIHRANKSTTPSSSRLVKSSKLANIDRITGKDRENKDTKDTIPTSRQPLKSKMMNSQSHSALNSLSNKNAKLGGLVRSGDLGKSTGEKQRDGLKRRLEYGEARPRKMLKVHVDTPVLSSSEPFVPTSSTITAPAHSTSSTAAQLAPPHTPRRTVAQSHIPVLQPTPARLLLSSTKLAHQSHGDDSDESFDSDTFVARPPTPPRPHMNSAPEPSVSTTPKSVRRIVARPPTPPRPHIDGSVPESMSTQPADSTIDARLNDGSGTLPASNQSTVLNTVPFSSVQDVEMRDDVPALPPSARISILPQPAASTFRPLSKSTSKRSDLGLGSMPPPSRIPCAVRPPVLTSATPAEGGLVTSRGASQLAKNNSLASLGRGVPTAAEGTPGAGAEPVRRKPSFPSSLSSTTLARPRDRMVSGPVLHRRDLAAMAEDPDNLPPTLSRSRGDLGKGDGLSGRKSPRSVSEPVRRTLPSQPSSSSLTASTSRREGLSLETSKSIAGLSDALNKLKVKRHDTSASSSLGGGSIRASGSLPNRPSSSFRDAHQEVPMAKSTSTSGFSRIPVSSSSSRLSSIHQPRQSISRLSTVSADGGDVSMDGDHVADTSLAALVCSNVGEGCLKGVVAFVDVRTEDGDEANAIFVEMLKGLGARVISRLTENVTHIIYKSGKSTTLSWWRKMDEDERPFIVGIGWITKCKERGERQDEEPCRVAVEEDVFQKRRKSMEPKALYNALNGPSRPSVLLDSSLNIARRKSLLYAPKVSSPLKKAYRRDYSFDEGVEED